MLLFLVGGTRSRSATVKKFRGPASYMMQCMLLRGKGRGMQRENCCLTDVNVSKKKREDAHVCACQPSVLSTLWFLSDW